MDFQQRFKGRMTVVKKEGIDSLISAGGIPIKANNTPLRINNYSSVQEASNYGDEVDLLHNFPNYHFRANITLSPKLGEGRSRHLNSSAMEYSFPERPIESSSPVFTRASRQKKIAMTPLENRSRSIMESQNSFRQLTNNRQEFSLLDQKRNKIPRGLLGRQHSRSVIYSRDQNTSISLNGSPKASDEHALMRRSSLTKDNTTHSSVIKVREIENENNQELPLRKLNSLDSRRGPEKYKAQKEMLNKISMKIADNTSILLDHRNSNSQLYNKIMKAKLHRISDNQFRFEKMAAIFNQEGIDYGLKADLDDNGEDIVKPYKEVTTFKRDRKIYSKTVVLPKIK